MASDDFEIELGPLWARARDGDEAAYRAGLHVVARRLRAYFARRLKSTPDSVEDLVQETLLALHLKRDTHDPALPVANWVHAIARYKLVDHWRRRGRREALHEPLDAGAFEIAAEPEPETTAGRDIAVLMAHLPDAQRSAIQLTRIDGLSVAEASARTGVSVSAIKVQVHRGLKRLSELVRNAP